MKNTEQLVAQSLLQIKAIKLNPANPFTWASGWKSPIYCDNRKILSYPAVRKEIYEGFGKIISEKYPDADIIAGVATGAIAHGVLVAEKMGKPFIYVRSSPKSHGLTNQVEGEYWPGAKVVVIEDLVSTGGSSLSAVEALRDRVRGDEALTRRILHKYSIKNVMGLNLLPLVRFDDPFEIIAHLMVGSEGTLAFLAGVTMRTEREYEHKASAMVYFSDIGEASRAVVEMRKLQDAAGERIVHSAEMLDSKSLASVGDATGEGLTAVLTETKAHTPEELAANVARIGELLGRFALYVPARFTDDPAEQAKYWAVRSGIFPAVGGSRPAGTTCLIEDVAFHIEDLPRATAELQALIARHGYDACIYGHALEDNYHFIINQSFSTPAEVARYEALMNDVAELVVGRYDGSLKAEHGTGRNMAPFLRRE